MRQRDVGIELHRKLDHQFSQYRRDVIARLASSRRADFVIPDDVPKSLSPWRLLRSSKRQRVRRRLQDYLTILASPLFDANFYQRAYADVATQDMLPALHYLLHGSDERRKPSAAVDPDDIDYLFPELAGREGNLVLNLIDLHLGARSD